MVKNYKSAVATTECLHAVPYKLHLTLNLESTLDLGSNDGVIDQGTILHLNNKWNQRFTIVHL